MKYLILLGVVVWVIWWLRTKRNDTDKTQDPSGQQAPQTMVRCAHCDLHLPQNDAVQGSLGVYCSTAHRSAKEG